MTWPGIYFALFFYLIFLCGLWYHGYDFVPGLKHMGNCIYNCDPTKFKCQHIIEYHQILVSIGFWCGPIQLPDMGKRRSYGQICLGAPAVLYTQASACAREGGRDQFSQAGVLASWVKTQTAQRDSCPIEARSVRMCLDSMVDEVLPLLLWRGVLVLTQR